jgi:hypothetical protein
MNKLSQFKLAAELAAQPLVDLEIEEEMGEEFESAPGKVVAAEEEEVRVMNIATPENRCEFSGQKFGLLTIEGEAEKDIKGNRQVNCLCDCGLHKVVMLSNLRAGLIKSCGHLRKRKTGIATLQNTTMQGQINGHPSSDSQPLSAPQNSSATRPPLHRVADQIEGLTRIVLGIDIQDLRLMCEELDRVEEQMPGFLVQQKEIAHLRSLVNKWAEFRAGLEG